MRLVGLLKVAASSLMVVFLLGLISAYLMRPTLRGRDGAPSEGVASLFERGAPSDPELPRMLGGLRGESMGRSRCHPSETVDEVRMKGLCRTETPDPDSSLWYVKSALPYPRAIRTRSSRGTVNVRSSPLFEADDTTNVIGEVDSGECIRVDGSKKTIHGIYFDVRIVDDRGDRCIGYISTLVVEHTT